MGSSIVAAAWDGFCGSIIQEFIYDLFYSQLTDDCEFPAEIRKALNNIFGQLCLRAKRVDLGSLLIRDSTRVLIEQLAVYRSVCTSVGLDRHVTATASWGARERALRAAMRQTHMMHAGLDSNEALGRYLRRLSEVGGTG